MDFQSEKYAINIDQGKDVINTFENQNNYNNPQNLEIPPVNYNQSSIIQPNKNRTIQYYKFLFYSMKLEIKNTELINLIRSSNISEILLWILSLIIINENNTTFVILHTVHFLRGILGLLILFKIPQSYALIKGMESEKYKDDLENKIFNDYARKVIDLEIFEKGRALKNMSIVYLIFTLINIFVDLIDFLTGISKFNDDLEDNSVKITVIVNFVIAILYLAIDFAYIFWFQTLKFTFPPLYFIPINEAFTGIFNRAKHIFKFGKKETDLRTEEMLNNNSKLGNENINQNKDMENNPINNIGNNQTNNHQNICDPYNKISPSDQNNRN